MSTGQTMTNGTKTEETGAGPLAPGQRWNVARRREVVLRIFKGESLAALSRELAVPLHKLERWRDKALAAMDLGLKERAADDPLQQEVDTAHRRIGELMMENELLRRRAEKTGPFPTRKSKR